VVVEKGTHAQPLEVHAHCTLIPPNSKVSTSIPADASPELSAALQAGSEEAANAEIVDEEGQVDS